MAERTTNRVLALCLIRVLEEHADVDHPLSQQQIIEYMDSGYGMACERKAIKRHVDALVEMGYDIAKPDEGGYYIRSRAFEDCELRLLIDGVLASRNIPKKQAVALIEKLKGLSSKYFREKMRHVRAVSEATGSDYNALFFNLDIVDEAIEKKRKIAFNYLEYGSDKKLHVKREEKYIYNPYQTFISNGRYYIVGNVDKYDNLSNFRIDRITNIQLLNTDIKPITELSEGLDIAQYLKERPYPFSSKAIPVTFRMQTSIIDDAVDWFGNDFEIRADGEGMCRITLKLNEYAAYYWALQYCDYAEIVRPDDLRLKVRTALERASKKYN